MARICGINLPNEKRIEVGLTYIYGIGRKSSAKILNDLNINKNIKVKDLSEADLNKLREKIDKIPTEGDLRRKVSLDIKRLQDVGSYKGYRHKRKLPVRGQRTKTNARTKRGKKVTMGSGRRKETKT
ncbi:MAG: 30S ribosomal protein S13 [uncultured bacterium]|nr:MAG: 30S ribosomal protein S13 [uncultured bacterium]KKT02478.1 MAG: 30S ribosomal protein S13, small subunit ribosomal protein S13 [Candidatus Peregrinibacteria bacterium GW2011_GWF2_43_17]KKT19762.1 MAG: 30S ribosomal protein S13 [Candidatus Peregrinibacteria bacterium GW2011_GWA2_43_8]HAU40201.1 30S ribosomal protein S13 [Candidatus Peregrinibacteria bacterium]